MLINTGSARRKVPAQRQRGRTILSHADPRAGRLTHLLGSKQQGTALIFALVMLLLLTILGITAVTTSSLQEKMAGNMRDQYMAQQAGDSILFDGQALIFNQKTKPLPSCPPDPVALIWDSSCLPTSTGAASADWWTTATDAWWTANGNVSGVANTHTAQEPRFVVENIQRVPINHEIGHKKKDEWIYFRTTGWSVGVSDYARGLFQGIYFKRSDSYVNP